MGRGDEQHEQEGQGRAGKRVEDGMKDTKEGRKGIKAGQKGH